ncbi:MAG TPA: cardiolipin synthase [Usitatibacter sp.]|jgi:cardiolipin synthase|nr:cardiolipin synthase [Usitatibacter sp.]
MYPLPWFDLFVGSYVVWVIVACASLLMSRRAPASTLAWMFAFIALPVVSGLYYLVFGPRRLHRRRVRYGRARGRLAGGTSGYLSKRELAKRPHLAADAAGLAAVARRLGQGEATLASAVEVLDDGDATMRALEVAIRAARDHVHMEYYIWEPDSIGTRFRDLLVEARSRGVEVRVLVDAVGSAALNAKFWLPLTACGGEVRIFNRLHLSFASLHFANFRTHRKIAICDGAVGLLGGVNLHEPACTMGAGEAAWRDAHVRIDGEPVWRMQQLFLENWAYSGPFQASEEEIARYFPLSMQEGRGLPTQIVASGPDDDNAPLHAFLIAAMSTARSRIWIETPYLIPDEPLETAMRIAELRGVDVQVIVPKQGDSKLVTAASHTYCESLRKAGIRIYEYGPPMLHAKTVVVDSTVAMIGTANMDNRSFRLNFEIAAAFYDATVIDHLAQRFAVDRDASNPFPARRRPDKLQLFLESVARLTSPVL